MKKLSLFLVIGILGVSAVSAQTAADSVKNTVQELFAAMKQSDSKTILACFTDSAILQTIARNREGEAIIKKENLKDFAAVIGSMPKDAADERISFDVVKVDGPLAIVWTPYKFYLSGQFSHCGVNAFQLIRQNGKWKIYYLIDTRRKQDCG